MGWLLVVAVMIVGTYYFHFMPALRRRKLRALNACLSQLGGRPQPSLPRHLFNEEQFQAARQTIDLEIMEQLVHQTVAEHRNVLARKKTQTQYLDDYGNQHTDAWLKELRYFARNVVFPIDTTQLGVHEHDLISSPAFDTFSDTSNKQIVDYWAGVIDSLVDAEDSDHCLELNSSMTGHEYEEFVAQKIRGCGWKATVTSGSGDHGADIIAESNGTRIAIQCKLYQSTVGNKSVQEAFSAKGFYDCDHSCVVTNSTYTPAARKAAAKLGVALLHHDDLVSYFAD